MRPCATGCSHRRSAARPSSRRSRSFTSSIDSGSIRRILACRERGPMSCVTSSGWRARLCRRSQSQLRRPDGSGRHQAGRRNLAAHGARDRMLHVHRSVRCDGLRGRVDGRPVAASDRRGHHLCRRRRARRSSTSPRTRRVPIRRRCASCISTAIRSGAARVCVSDTVGHATPEGAAAVVRFIAGVVEACGGGVGIDWHGHRDRDFAVVNSIAALEASADYRSAWLGDRHWRARRQHADGHAAGQPGAHGLHRPGSVRAG